LADEAEQPREERGEAEDRGRDGEPPAMLAALERRALLLVDRLAAAARRDHHRRLVGVGERRRPFPDGAAEPRRELVEVPGRLAPGAAPLVPLSQPRQPLLGTLVHARSIGSVAATMSAPALAGVL